MNDALSLLLALLAGAALGALFFGGLWWTVRRSVVSPHPAIWIFGSLAIRMPIILGGFYLLAQGGWPTLFAAMLGFLVVRVLVTRFSPAPTQNSVRDSRDGAS